jgi:hypothetical protein
MCDVVAYFSNIHALNKKGPKNRTLRNTRQENEGWQKHSEKEQNTDH